MPIETVRLGRAARSAVSIGMTGEIDFEMSFSDAGSQQNNRVAVLRF
jgi:hypothetical protein